MPYKYILHLIIFLFLTNCTTGNLILNKPSTSIVNGYSNKGFALVYSDDLYKQKIITNLINGKSIIGIVGKNSIYPSFNNVVLSIRISQELDLDTNQPYVEILEILENSIFVAMQAKTYDEEKNVAIKAPVNDISINDLSLVKNDKKKKYL